MGIDFLDLTFRLEKSLKVKLPRNHFDDFFKRLESPRDLTVSQLHQCILSAKRWTDDEINCHKCSIRVLSTPVPGFCRHCGAAVRIDNYVMMTIRRCIVDAIGVKPEKIRPDSTLIKDLGMS
jgi:acyl carrier protein